MIDKIDKPNAPAPYQITRPKDAKEDQHRPPSQREEQERRYQKELAEKAQEKFGTKRVTVKPIRVARENISKCSFRAVTLSKGTGILQIDVTWKDGRTTKGALTMLTDMNQFVQLKKFSPGQDVPDEFWARGTVVELGIIQAVPSAEAKPQAQEITSVTAKSHVGKPDKDINWKMMAVYAAIAVAFLTIIILILRS